MCWQIDLIMNLYLYLRHLLFQLATTPTTWDLTESFHTRRKTSAPCPSMWTFRSYPSVKRSLPGHQVSQNFYCFPEQNSKVWMSRQLFRVRVWDQTQSIPGTIHPLHLSSLSYVCHDELGLILRSSGEIFLSASSCCGVQNAFNAFCLTTFTMRLY